jgi:hypothetical protein
MTTGLITLAIASVVRVFRSKRKVKRRTLFRDPNFLKYFQAFNSPKTYQ